MNLSWFSRTPCTILYSRSVGPLLLPRCSPARFYATHRDIPSSSISQSLDTERTARPRDTVGPFQLGLAQTPLRKGEKIKKWSELSTGEKVVRSTARTSNLVVILFGAGLSALLVYSLTSELFSKNSPTVLYGEACERIKASPLVAKFLHGPLIFHNNPPSVIRPRHRNRHVISQVMVDSYGQEHMVMTFYVQGRPPGFDEPASDASYLESAKEWVQDKMLVLTELTLDESVAWAQERANAAWEQTKSLFRYLSGSPVPSPTPLAASTPDGEQQKQEKGSDWSFAGLFGSLRSPRGRRAEPEPQPDGRTFDEGEVHADFIRNQDGYFVFRYLLIDMPTTRDPKRARIFVERAPGVRDNESVMRWQS